MDNLGEAVRAKAMDIANARLWEGDDEGPAIRIGIAQTKSWAVSRRRGMDLDIDRRAFR